jgi:hypothetical protein
LTIIICFFIITRPVYKWENCCQKCCVLGRHYLLLD